jgi:hypothetical protein
MRNASWRVSSGTSAASARTCNRLAHAENLRVFGSIFLGRRLRPDTEKKSPSVSKSDQLTIP